MNKSKVFLVILILTIFITYSPLLNTEFWADDYLHIERIKLLGTSALFKDFFTAWILKSSDTPTWWTSPAIELQYFRPLISLSFFMDILLWDIKPMGFHLTNIIFHILTSILIFRLATFIFKENLTAFLIALIFGIHPCHMEAVAWICCRTDVIAGFFYYFSLFTFLKFRQEKEKRHFPLFPFSLILYICALLSKEMAITLPLVLIVFDRLYSSGEKDSYSLYIRIKKSILYYLPFFIVTIVYLGIRFKIFGGLGSVPYPFSHSLLRPGFSFFVFRNMTLYFANILYFIPIDLMVAYPFFVKHSPLIFLLAGLVAGGIYMLSKFTVNKRNAFFLLLSGLFAMLPVSFLSVGQRFLYIPSGCFFLCLGYIIFKNRPWRKEILICYLLLIFFVTQGGNFISYRIGSYMESIKDTIKTELKDSSSPVELYFIDLPILALIGLPHSLRLECPHIKFSMEILSVSPDLLPSNNPFYSYIKVPNPYTMIIGQKDKTYFGTYLELAFLGGEANFDSGRVFIRENFTVTVSKLKNDLPREFCFTFNSPVTAKNKIFFRGRNMQVYPVKIKKLMSHHPHL
ncbi:MAG: hypothetical protein SV062_06940 [Thermodesulfobacteriota bacterium]|nr:hypothetical protein [Thermodesulfobacteriota bacterium]